MSPCSSSTSTILYSHYCPNTTTPTDRVKLDNIQMSLSDDEEDFLSADEDVDEHQQQAIPAAPTRTERDHDESSYPPAPPPTPALSSSPSSTGPATSLVDRASPAESAKSAPSQYNWRLPPAATSKSTSQCQANTSSSRKESSQINEATDKAQQARLALDKLSEKLSHQEKSLFEMVAGDIKKVAIRATDTLAPQAPKHSGTSTSSEPATGDESLPSSLVDLGTSIGSWGWNNASKLLTSASKVTTQVTSQVSSQVNAILAPMPAEVKKDNK